MGKRPSHRDEHDQREIGDSRYEACIPRPAEIPPMLDSGRRFLRMEEGGNDHFCFEVSEGELFGFAGLWDGWKDASSTWIKTCSILTTTPNAVTSAIHDRMPVILDPDGYDLWLDPGMTNANIVSELLKPYDATLMRSYPVSTRINHVGNDDEECSRPMEVAETQNQLFLITR